MRNSFLINIILLILINVLIKPAFIFAVEIPVQNHVGHDVYGMYFTFLNLGYIFQLMADLGLQNLTSAELPRDRSTFARLISNGVTIKVLLAFLFVVVMSIFGWVLGYWEMDAKLFSILIFNVLLISILQYVRANISGLGLYFKDSLISIVDKFLMLVVLSVLLYGSRLVDLDIYTFALVQTFSIVCAIGVGMFVLNGRVQWVKPDMSYMFSLIKRSIPYGTLIAIMFLYTRIDAIMIEAMLSDGLHQAGLYASAYRLYDAVAMISFLFATLLLPMFTELENDVKARDRLYYGSLNMIVGMSLIIALPLVLAKSEIMNGLYEVTTAGSIASFALLLMAFIFKSTLFVTSTLLTSAKRFRVLIILFSISIGLNFGSNLILIPSMGIAGASWSTLITQFFIAVGCIWLCHGKGLVSLRIRDYVKMASFSIALLVVFVYYQYYSAVTVQWPALLVFVLVAGVIFILLNFKQIAQLSTRITRR